MHLIVQKKDLADILGRMKGIPIQKSMSNILGHFLLDAVEGMLSITGMNYEVGIKLQVNCEVLDSGRIAVPAKKLMGLVGQAPEGAITLKTEAEGNWLTASVKKYSVRIPMMDPDNLPPLQEVEEKSVVTLPEGVLLEMADKCGFAISTDETRPNLNGLYMRFTKSDPPTVDAVSTDGKRLSLVHREVTAVDMDVEELGCLVHRRGIQEMKLFLKGDIENVRMVIDRKGIRLERPEGFLVVRQIEMEFPNYDMVVPKDFNWNFIVPTATLVEMVRRVSISASEENFMVILRLQDGVLEVEAGDNEGGTAKDQADLSYDGEPIEIAYNYRYLLEALNAFGGSTNVEFRIKDNYAASMIVAADGKDEVVQLIMPIRRTV